jgi:lipopolysaccharide export LptBFGC system permease protein LptF
MSRSSGGTVTSPVSPALGGLWLSILRVPMLLDTVLPFAFLFAALLSLLGLSRKLELVVARASGVSVWGFLKGPVVVAMLVARQRPCCSIRSPCSPARLLREWRPN